jgi:hypothetical protein
MLTHIASMLLALQPLSPAPPGEAMALGEAMGLSAGDLRIVAVEQTGGPPYVPREGRVYRLGGASVSDVRLGEMLIIRRPGAVADIGLLRVVSVHTENFATTSALARLEARGEAFPLKGDLVTKLAPTDMPAIKKPDASALKEGFRPALNPLVMPSVPGAQATQTTQTTQTTQGARTAPTAGPSSAQGAKGLAEGINKDQPKGQAGPAPRTGLLPGLLPAPPPPADPGMGAGANRIAAFPPGMPRLLEQHPIYFFKGSAEISPKGVVRLKEWTDAWGKTDLAYFLAVPQNQLRLQKLTADRLAALQRELRHLGVATVEMKTDENNGSGPFDVVYVGVEGLAR